MNVFIFLLRIVSVMKTDIKIPFTAKHKVKYRKIQSKIPLKHKIKYHKNTKLFVDSTIYYYLCKQKYIEYEVFR